MSFNILLENGSALLREDGANLLLESATSAPVTPGRMTITQLAGTATPTAAAATLTVTAGAGTMTLTRTT